MKVLIVGATGGTGRHIVERALAAGHEVSAFVRRPAAVTLEHPRLRVAKGDVLDLATVTDALRGHDAVLSALGPAAGTKAGTLISDGTTNILRAMEKERVQRLVVESGLMVGECRGMSGPKRAIVAAFRLVHRELCADKRRTEALVRASNVRWTIVRPPTLGDRPARGAFRIGVDLDVRLTATMAHADVAACMVQVLADDTRVGQTLEISY